jgi:hypothetical protein
MLLRRCAFLLVLFLAACQSVFVAAPSPTAAPMPPTDTLSPTVQLSALSEASLPTASPTPTLTETSIPSPTPEPSATYTATPTALPSSLGQDPADWKDWPVNPIVPERALQIYQIGQALGNDPHAFSVFGDCQSEPDVFMGLYETDPAALAGLPPELQQTVAWFSGSFNRESPTVRPGTTTGALLWTLWHQNKYTCGKFETPLQCELRIHKPAFVIIHVGTHYENRNQAYMRMILDQLIAAGVVPILASKADDRELNDHVNAEYAQLAAEYNIPFWNFWAAVKDLPNRGLYTREDAKYQGDLYLTPDAVAIHRLSALQALDTVWRAVTGG